MTSAWVPHGHIRDEDLEESYQNARAAVNSSGNSRDPKEYHSIHLMEDLCNLSWFPRPHYKTNSQFPPSDTKGPNKACDLATQYVDDIHKWHLFFFHEGKRAKNSSESKIRALENQAQGYCKEFIESHEDVSLVYANTFVGGYVRFWSFTRGDSKLRGFWNGDEKDHFEHYRDVGLDEHFHDIQRALDGIKSMPVSALRRGQDHSQIGVSSFSLKVPTTYSVPMQPASSDVPTTLRGYQVNYSAPVNLASSSLATTPTPVAFDTSISSAPVALRDEDYVDVTLVQYGRDISHHVYRFQTPRGPVEKLGSEFDVSTDPRGNQCMVYYGKLSGTYFWTTSLDPESEHVRIDTKKKRHI
ncbi:hypothetical protein B0O99DRAFT_601762 [Bisporella sp. PMI_857]|nr:hypothetical protein B0O99DRAFT_601762 [Bisporella sp. PMI_857]